jgi:hypothetical protein
MKPPAKTSGGKRQAKRMAAVMREKHRLAIAQNRPPKIPDAALRALAVLGLPAKPALYERGINLLCQLLAEANNA